MTISDIIEEETSTFAADASIKPTSYAEMLKVDSGLIALHVKTRHEACCLLEVSLCGEKLDLLMEKYLQLLKRQEQVRNAVYLAEQVSIPLPAVPTVARRDFSSSVPTLRRIEAEIEVKVRRVEIVMEQVIQSLKSLQTQLRQFSDLNGATARELISCSLPELAQNKLKLAEREDQLAETINRML